MSTTSFWNIICSKHRTFHANASKYLNGLASSAACLGSGHRVIWKSQLAILDVNNIGNYADQSLDRRKMIGVRLEQNMQKKIQRLISCVVEECWRRVLEKTIFEWCGQERWRRRLYRRVM